MLNEPVGYDERPRDDWTPQRGSRRGLTHGLVWAGGLIVAQAPLVASWPYLVLPWLPRVIVAFLLTWGLTAVVLSAAGMGSKVLLRAGVGLAALVLVAQHFVFAVQGVPATGGAMGLYTWPLAYIEHVIDPSGGETSIAGWRWFHPYALLMANGPPLVVGGWVAMLLHRNA
jgi:hypothetical protein